MICEICGRSFNNGVKLELEGSVVNACDNCSGYGEILSRITTVREKPKSVEVKTPAYDMQEFESEETLADDYGERVRKARENRRLKQSDLARLINEPESIVHRIESGKFEPDESLIRKLERKLEVKLMLNVENAPRLVGKSADGEKTLGDVVVVRKKKGDE